MANHNSLNPEHLFVLDIETIPQVEHFDALSDHWKELWTDKISKTMPEMNEPAIIYEKKAGIMAEFGKIICISFGVFYYDRSKRLCLRVRSFADSSEEKILKQFIRAADRMFEKVRDFQFAGHNIKEFDIPFICRRMMIHGIGLPEYLQLNGKKPWETNLIDTMQLWKFGDYKNYTSLHLLASVLGVQSPKDLMDGSKVKQVFYEEKNLRKIAHYCRNDVIAVARVLLRLQQLPLLPDEQIFISNGS